MEESLSTGGLTDIINTFELKRADIRTYSPLALAHIGDSVYEQIIRTIVISKGNVSPNRLHKATVKYVNAKTQALIITKIMDLLSEDELNQFRRGKNSSPGHKAKNSGLSEYLKATGFETLVGYLYMTNQYSRILELCKIGLGMVEV